MRQVDDGKYHVERSVIHEHNNEFTVVLHEPAEAVVVRMIAFEVPPFHVHEDACREELGILGCFLRLQHFDDEAVPFADAEVAVGLLDFRNDL